MTKFSCNRINSFVKSCRYVPKVCLIVYNFAVFSPVISLKTGTIFLGKESNGEIASIPAEGQTTIHSGLIMGFGQIRVTVTAEIPEGLVFNK